MPLEIDLANQQDFITNVPVNSKLENQASKNQIDDVSSKFNSLITLTVNAYNQYTNNCTASLKNTAKKPRNECNPTTESNNKENNDVDLTCLDNSNDLDDSFEEFNSVFTKLLTKIRSAKESQHFEFMTIIRQTNINCLYEFAATLLQAHGCGQLSSDENLEQKTVILKRTIELLHMLVTNQNQENDDDESSIMCCAHLSKNFNFTSTLCHLLLKYCLKSAIDPSKKPSIATSTTSSSSSSSSSSSLLNEKSFRLAFSVLNKLTLDNPLFVIDTYVRQFVDICIRKILDPNQLQLSYVQFLSNTIRNNRKELEPILHSADSYYSLCRKLLSIVQQETNPNIAMNSLTIVVILCFDEAFSVRSKGLVSNEKFILNINVALSILCSSREDDLMESCKPDLARTNHNFNLCTQKINSLNFLIEMFKMDKVVKTLENNEDYSNLFMFKLNHLLIENTYRTKTSNSSASSPTTKSLFSNFAIKIFNILEILATSSEKLANNLLHIIFNTRKFVEEKSCISNEYDLSKKLQDLVLNSSVKLKSGTMGKKRPISNTQEESYEILAEYYFRLIKLVNADESLKGPFIENGLFYLGLYKYFNSLLKNNRMFELKDFEKSTGQMLEILVDNFKQIYGLYSTFKLTGTDNDLSGQIFFYIISSIEIILNRLETTASKPKLKLENSNNFLKSLVDIVELNHLTAPVSSQSRIQSWSMIADNFIMSEENILIVCRVILRMAISEDSKCDKELKEIIFGIFKNENFLMLLSYGMLEIDRLNLTSTAYDLFGDLKPLNNSRFKFPFDLFLAIDSRLKLESRSYLGINKTQSNQNPIVSNLNTTIDFGGRTTTSAINLELFDHYEKQIELKNEQEAKMSLIVNEYLSRCMSLEQMLKQNRDKTREYSHMITRLSKDMASFEVKNADLVRCNQDLKLSNEQMSEDLKRIEGQMDCLKTQFEKEQNDNEEAITKLQEQLKLEQVERKQVLNKLSEARSKVVEVEKVRQALETRNEEVEAELERKLKEFELKSVEFGKLKKEHDRVKEILSYVKSNC